MTAPRSRTTQICTYAGSLLAAFGAAFPAISHAQSTSFNGTVALSSQLIDRGIAVTPVTPIVQAEASLNTSSGWSLGLSGSTEARSFGHVTEAIADVSHAWSLSSNWQMQAGLLYYDYPDNPRAKAFDRTEAGLNWIYRDILTFGLSAICVTGNEGDHHPRGAADLNVHWPLAWHFSLSAGAGAAQSLAASSYYDHYRHEYVGRATPLYGYGQLGLLWNYGPWRVELDRVAVDPAARSRLDGLAAAPWVATVSWSF
ncbi:MAG TPA: TorF family putative porin [Dyella sp.]|nr:TorF family putative porin [Dyella sp.]